MEIGQIIREAKQKILESELLVYHCLGTESEIKEWFTGHSDEDAGASKPSAKADLR